MPPVVVYWPDVGWDASVQQDQQQLLGWSWPPESEGAACVVVVASKQHPRLPNCCPPAQPLGVLHTGSGACSQAQKRSSPAGGTQGAVWLTLSLPESGTRPALPRLHSCWLHGRQLPDASLATVLYEVRPRGRCAAAAPAGGQPITHDSQLHRVLRVLDAAATHECCSHAASPKQHRALLLAQRHAHVRSCWRSAIVGELAARYDVLRQAERPPTLLFLLLLDWLAGAAVHRALGRHHQAAAHAVRIWLAALLQGGPAGTARWFVGAKPLGVKLHAQLCQALSAALLQFAHANAVAGARLAPLASPAVRLLAASGRLPLLGGLSIQLAVLADALFILGAPLLALRAVAAAWLRLHWAGVTNLWRKLYRPAAEQHPRPQAFRMERLTVGSLLLTPLLLLAPTLCAYGAAVAALAAVPLACRALLKGASASGTALLLRATRTASYASPPAWMEPLPGGDAQVMSLRRR